MKVKVGERAPELAPESSLDITVWLGDFLGKSAGLYQKDDTPGCATEAHGFRDSAARIEELGAVVLGVSVDAAEVHRAFARKHYLPFPLLSDAGRKVSDAYEFFAPDGKYARRVKFIVDGDGQISGIFESTDPATHAGEVLRERKRIK